MKCQYSDLQFYSKNGKKYLVDFTEVLDESKLMETIHSGKKKSNCVTFWAPTP
jgi:hypothetical protein